MIVKWSKDGNSSFEAKFDGFRNNIFRCENHGGQKGVDSYIEKNIWLFGFKFTYTNVNYDDIVFVRLEPGKNYTSDENSHNVRLLREVLDNLVKTNSYYKKKLAFNWNYYIREDGEILYFITARKDYFLNHGLSMLVEGTREITFNEGDLEYFPEYNPFHTENIQRILLYPY